jgi:hypothetical protein
MKEVRVGMKFLVVQVQLFDRLQKFIADGPTTDIIPAGLDRLSHLCKACEPVNLGYAEDMRSQLSQNSQA